MKDNKFCPFCGEKTEKNDAFCPKCGKPLKDKKQEKEVEPKEKEIITKENKGKENKIVDSKTKFYEQAWFMWVTLIVFAPVGIFIMWKFHPEMKKNTKIILSIVFGILFIIIFSSNDDAVNDDLNPNNHENTKKEKVVEVEKVKVTVADFSNMKKSSIESWCNTNNILCDITEEYSDTVKKGSFVRQSTAAGTTIHEGDFISIVYSLGKEPTMEYKNALKKAETYSEIMHMSKKAIYDQLTSEYGEQFPADAAQYAIDNIKANWKANALEKAKVYRDEMSMSKSAIYDQLTSEYGEQFTKSEAQYAINHLDD